MPRGGDLAKVLAEHRRNGTFLSLGRGWSYFIQTAKALRYLHDPNELKGMGSDGVLGHGDIKPDNCEQSFPSASPLYPSTLSDSTAC